MPEATHFFADHHEARTSEKHVTRATADSFFIAAAMHARRSADISNIWLYLIHSNIPIPSYLTLK